MRVGTRCVRHSGFVEDFEEFISVRQLYFTKKRERHHMPTDLILEGRRFGPQSGWKYFSRDAGWSVSYDH